MAAVVDRDRDFGGEELTLQRLQVGSIVDESGGYLVAKFVGALPDFAELIAKLTELCLSVSKLFFET